MCTVTYLPIKAGEFILTSSRDEQTTRESASFPFTAEDGGSTFIYPKDGKAGGTWVVTSNRGITICLLNGAFEKHIPAPPYRKSRGIVVLDAIKSSSFDVFIQEYDLVDVEPFTMVIVEHSSPVRHRVREFRWDGQQKYVVSKNILKEHIWSSATLYDVETVKAREQWFKKWLEEHNKYSISMSRGFHFNAGANDPSIDVMMNRGDQVKTVSVTTIAANMRKLKMVYQDTEQPTILEQELILG